MRRTRSKRGYSFRDRLWLFSALILLVAGVAMINCSFNLPGMVAAEAESSAGGVSAPETPKDEPVMIPLADAPPGSTWGPPSDGVSVTPPSTTPSSTISLDVRDANLLDVLSLLAYKLNANIIFLEQPSTITIKTESLSPITTLQVVLQKEGYDYIILGRNYIVGGRDRLYSDFFNRIMLSRYDLFYVSPSAMEGYFSQLGVPVQSLTVDANQQSIWIQGTPITLGKARELINALDIMENAAFAEGGARKIRMPVAMASGSRAGEELNALVDLLSILLDGYRDGRGEFGWVTWDHPDPIPSITMQWDSPIIKPYDIKMKITRDFAGDPNNEIRYLIAEGSPANIELVEQMIAAIAGTPGTPISFPEIVELDSFLFDLPQGGSDYSFNYTPQTGQYTVSLKAVPSEGGTLQGNGSYSSGATVTVSAAAASGYSFVRWIENGAEVSTSSSYTFTLYSNRTLEAVFVADSEGGEDQPENGEDGVDEDLN